MKCPVCDLLLDAEIIECPQCSWRLLSNLGLSEQAAYNRRLEEARQRWCSLGRYDQTPKGVEQSTVATSNANVAIGGHII